MHWLFAMAKSSFRSMGYGSIESYIMVPIIMRSLNDIYSQIWVTKSHQRSAIAMLTETHRNKNTSLKEMYLSLFSCWHCISPYRPIWVSASQTDWARLTSHCKISALFRQISLVCLGCQERDWYTLWECISWLNNMQEW